MREREIWIRLLKKQIVNDVAVQCNLIGRSLQKSEDTEETASEVMTPDDEATKPVVARAMTEAFGEVKRVCQQYLITGRDTDDNRLERINEMNRSTETISSGSLGTYSLIPGQSYIIRVITDVSVTVSTSTDKVLGQVTGTGQFEYIPSSNERIKIEGSDGKAEVTYFFGDFGMYELKLSMPASFNISMTETIKSCAHRMMVDYVMSAVLNNQLPEKAKEYANFFTGDIEGLRDALRSRIKLMGRRPTDWSTVPVPKDRTMCHLRNRLFPMRTHVFPVRTNWFPSRLHPVSHHVSRSRILIFPQIFCHILISSVSTRL